MNTKALSQLFGAIAAGITVGVLIGYRTNPWLGWIAGILLAFLSADISHASKTIRWIISEFAKGVKKSLGVIKEVGENRFVKFGELLVLVGTVVCYLFIGLCAWAVASSTSVTYLFPFLRSAGKEVVTAIDELIFLPVIGMFLCGMVTVVGLIATRIISCSTEIRKPNWPLLRVAFPRVTSSNLSRDTKEELETGSAEAKEDFLLKILWRDANGSLLNKKRLALLCIVTGGIAIAPWLLALSATVIGAIVLLDMLLTGFIVLATSRNLIAGFCTALGIAIWFVLYPRFEGGAAEYARLCAFALTGGAFGVSIHIFREWLLSLPEPEKVPTRT